MTYKYAPLLALVAAACTNDVPTLHTLATARAQIAVAPPFEEISTQFGHFSWRLVSAPEGAPTPDLMFDPPTPLAPWIVVFPYQRGIYVYDRWFVGPAEDELNYHVVLTVAGATPIAEIKGPNASPVGASIVLDGSTSRSPEQRSLSFQWRLATSPESSAATLVDAQTASVTFTPDVRGDYMLELRVFDGELWSVPAMVTVSGQ